MPYPLSWKLLTTDNDTPVDLTILTQAVVQAVQAAGTTRSFEDALLIRDEIKRLPPPVLTELLNNVMLNLVSVDPDLCRWFIVDIFLHDADPEGRADVAERINLLLDDLHSR
ncbi:MAG TPA: hypothetical protein V6C65_18940 [Allocoleopsis sp.]